VAGFSVSFTHTRELIIFAVGNLKKQENETEYQRLDTVYQWRLTHCVSDSTGRDIITAV
jgi:hypothetical protein